MSSAGKHTSKNGAGSHATVKPNGYSTHNEKGSEGSVTAIGTSKDTARSVDLDKYRLRFSKIEKSTECLRSKIKVLMDEEREKRRIAEEMDLKESAKNVIVYLTWLTCCSSLLIVGLLSINVAAYMNLVAGSLCILAGTLGSSVAAMLSVLERRADGWEFSNGTTYPDDEKKARFNERMVPFFRARPWLGAAMGLLLFLGIQSNYLMKAEEPANLYKLGFACLLAGLFAKTLVKKLKVMFDNLVGK